MFDFSGFAHTPGMDGLRQTVESVIGWGPWDHNRAFIAPVILDGASLDAGGTPTTLIRPGLLLGQNRTTLKCKEWNPTGTDGSQDLYGVMLYDASTQLFGANQDRWFGFALVGGNVKASSLIIPGNASAGIDGDANEHYVRAAMSGRFMFDDYPHQWPNSPWKNYQAKTANYTVVDQDNGTFFTTLGASGAVTFTLPAVASAKGQRYLFYNAVDQNMTVQSAAANGLITFNNAAASSVAFSTAGNKIGAAVEVIGISGSKWLVRPSGANTMTVA